MKRGNFPILFQIALNLEKKHTSIHPSNHHHCSKPSIRTKAGEIETEKTDKKKLLKKHFQVKNRSAASSEVTFQPHSMMSMKDAVDDSNRTKYTYREREHQQHKGARYQCEKKR